jgi:hypothetical protein
MVLPSTAVSILLQRDTGLLAIICDDMVVRLIDIETRRVVRELSGFHGRILDIVGYFFVYGNPDSKDTRLFLQILGG